MWEIGQRSSLLQNEPSPWIERGELRSKKALSKTFRNTHREKYEKTGGRDVFLWVNGGD